MKQGDKCEVKWIDTVAYHGWHEKEAIDELTHGYIVKSLGYYLGTRSSGAFIAIAQNYEAQSDKYGNISFIPRGAVISIRKR